MTEPNVPLLRKVVEWVEEQEQLPAGKRTWNQRRWIVVVDREEPCGTYMCVAGKVALDDGWRPVNNRLGHCAYVTKDDGENASVSDVARDLLGITPAQSRGLFDQNNTAARIRLTAEIIAGERL